MSSSKLTPGSQIAVHCPKKQFSLTSTKLRCRSSRRNFTAYTTLKQHKHAFLEKYNVKAECMDFYQSNRSQEDVKGLIDTLVENVQSGACTHLLITPEFFVSDTGQQLINGRLNVETMNTVIVIDEFHTAHQMGIPEKGTTQTNGNDCFRPSMNKIHHFIKPGQSLMIMSGTPTIPVMISTLAQIS